MSRERFPFPIANAWYGVCPSADLMAGDVRPLRYLDRDLVAFRTQSGKACVLDAFCPHLGAHLGWGGGVEGESIVCPFHAWKFDGSGTCTEVPYASKIPPKAVARAWPTVERNGMILIWHHAEGAPPSFDVPTLPSFNEPASWLPHLLHRWEIHSHNQEINENVVDYAHFRHVHRMQNPPAMEAMDVEHSRLHIRYFAPPKSRVDITMYGLGVQVVEEHDGFGGGYELVHATYITPVAGDEIEMTQLFTVQRRAGESEDEIRAAHERYSMIMAENLQRDIAIWNHKSYIAAPVLADNDGPVLAFRRWAQTFYSPGAAVGR